MSFPFNIYLLAFASAGLTTLLSMPLWRRWSHQIGLVDDPGHRKIHDRPVALAGGLAVVTGLILPIGLGLVALKIGLLGGEPSAPQNAPRVPGLELSGWLSLALSRRGGQLAIIFLGAAGMVVLGWLDDKYELSPGLKFGGQFLIAALVAVAGIRITLFVHSAAFSYAITILWILTMTNALNFMDNMNGLCAGLGAISAWFFAWAAASQGQYLVALIAFLTCGALLGFLPYNFPRASVFLGDAGSHLVGYLLGILAILPHFYSRQNPNAWAVLKPLLILAVPLGDLFWVVLLRWRKRQPIYLGDTNHLSHRLVRRGWSKPGAVLVIWLLAALLGSISFLPF
jgi:UDP-GlcNAc:undecaprenyl-phosphate GlcNAc-1-phosphate transferase